MKKSNIVELVINMAETQPYTPAFYFPLHYTFENTLAFLPYSFSQLLNLSKEYAQGLNTLGINNQKKVLLLFKPNIHFIAITYALLAVGAIPVFIDPGMSLATLLNCVEKVQPDVMFGSKLAVLLRHIYKKPFSSVKTTILAESQGLNRIQGLGDIRIKHWIDMPIVDSKNNETAVIAFTSGSTGVPKGVVYTHRNFIVMLELLKNELGIKKGNIDLPGLYIFALLNPPLGVTTVMPKMDVAKPAKLKADTFVNIIETMGVNTSFGSPTIWNKVSDYCLEQNVTMRSLQRIFIAGASVPPSLLQKLSAVAPNAETFTPYGATEGLPLTNISAKEILSGIHEKTEQGKGFCIGKPLSNHEIKVIKITDEPISHWSNDLIVPNGVIGEICVKGDVVTHSYFQDDYHNRLTKIQEPNGFWHRMGDLGYYDQDHNLWICGRKSHRVETCEGTLFPDMIEAIYNQHPLVKRSALVGVGQKGNQKPVIVIEPKNSKILRDKNLQNQIVKELMILGEKSNLPTSINTFYFYPNFPVDVRHNVKIQRDKLAAWCAKRLGKQNN